MILIVLSRPKYFDIASWGIRKVTNFPASHASIHMVGKGLFSGERLVFESTSHGVVITHPSIWDKKNRPVVVYEMCKELNSGNTALKEMWSMLGANYDYKGVAHFAIRLLLNKIFGIKLAVPDTPDQVFCSELVARWLNEVRSLTGKNPIPLSPDAVSPAGLSKELDRSELFRSASCELSSSVISTSEL